MQSTPPTVPMPSAQPPTSAMPPASYPYPYYPPPPPKSDAGKILVIVVVIIIVVVAVTVGIGAVLYVMMSDLTGPDGGPQTIGITVTSGAASWQLQVTNAPATHNIATTTFLMRWSSNATIVVPPGQISLEALKTQTAGIRYVPVGGLSQTQLRVLDVITITKAGVYVAGMQVTIADGATLMWQGTLQ